MNRVASATGGDKQWFTIDNTSSTGHGFQYQYWSTAGNNYGGTSIQSFDQRRSLVVKSGEHPEFARVGHARCRFVGTLYLAGVNLDTNQIWCLRSTNAKNAAVTPTFDVVRPINLGGDIVSGEPINPEGIVGQVYLAVDRSGTRQNRNVYILASTQPAGFTTGTDVMMVRSTNFGATFSAPRRVNDDPVNHAK